MNAFTEWLSKRYMLIPIRTLRLIAEAWIVERTKTWEAHPDDYDGPCLCQECCSYGVD